MILPRPLWIFGYGSLLFRPDFPFEERHPAWIKGFVRRLDQGSPDHRGTPERLGRVATLLPTDDPTVPCGGAVYRVEDEQAGAVLARLDHREQGGYDRLILEAHLPAQGRSVEVITWIATPENPYHLGPAATEVMLTQIRAAVGPSGRNLDYVLHLAEALTALGIDDPHVHPIARALRVAGP